MLLLLYSIWNFLHRGSDMPFDLVEILGFGENTCISTFPFRHFSQHLCFESIPFSKPRFVLSTSNEMKMLAICRRSYNLIHLCPRICFVLCLLTLPLVTDTNSFFHQRFKFRGNRKKHPCMLASGQGYSKIFEYYSNLVWNTA